MTAHQITVTNSLRAFGNGPSSLWNAYNWNAFKWGEGTEKIPMSFRHLVAIDALAPTSSRGFRFVHLVTIDPLTLDSGRGFNFTRQITNTLAPESDSPSQYLTDAAGYYHVFPGGVTDADSRVDSSWTAAATATATWTPTAASATSWSNA